MKIVKLYVYNNLNSNKIILPKKNVYYTFELPINKFDFSTLNIKIVPDHDWAKMNMLEDAYKYVQKTNIFDELINTKNPMELFVLSATLTSFEQANKLSFLEREYPNIRRDNVMFVGETKFKIDILQGLREILDNTGKSHMDLVIIEDSMSVLLDVTKLNNPKIKCYLVSDFI